MGQLINGVWTEDDQKISASDGSFQRADMEFRNWITPDGAPGPTGSGGFTAETGRYHLYVADACPWAHRARMFRTIKGLTEHISMDIVHPDMMADGWTFATDFPGATGDRLMGSTFVREIYTAADPTFTGRVTVPIVWDTHTNTIVSNESSEIIRMFNSAFNGLTGNTDDYCPSDLHDEIALVNDRVYHTLNNGVYRSGFARSQAAYETAVTELFDTLDWLEARLSTQRYIAGDRPTEADWRLVPTLFRFDLVYHTHFKCNRARICDYPALWAYAREFYQWDGIAETINFDAIARHYYFSHRSINPYGIIPVGPRADWDEPHGR